MVRRCQPDSKQRRAYAPGVTAKPWRERRRRRNQASATPAWLPSMFCSRGHDSRSGLELPHLVMVEFGATVNSESSATTMRIRRLGHLASSRMFIAQASVRKRT